MLSFLRKYQRGFFLFVTFLLILSFSVFGAISTFMETRSTEEKPLGSTVAGTPIFPSAVHRLSRFLSTDAEAFLPGEFPNFCNDGVIRRDFLATGLSELFLEAYWDVFSGGLKKRLASARAYRPYAHPEAPYFSAEAIWERFLPEMKDGLREVSSQEEASLETFASLAKLYLLQASLPPELLRQILLSHAGQMAWIRPDPLLQRGDFSLFGFHSFSDWFGPRFVDLHAQWILNEAAEAEKEGIQVSLEEAKGDLFRNFSDAVKKRGASFKGLSFADHLASLGFSEREAAETWRFVLLFRKRNRHVADGILVDRLPYQEFAAYSSEEIHIDQYSWDPSLSMRSLADGLELEIYLSAVSPDLSLDAPPQTFYSAQEVEKRMPDLVRSFFSAKVTRATKEQIALRASLREIASWQKDPEHWDLLRQKFPRLPVLPSEDLDPALKAEVDAWTRLRLLEIHPEWIEEELSYFPPKVQEFSLSSVSCSLPSIQDPRRLAARLECALLEDGDAKESLRKYCDDGDTFYRFEEIEGKKKGAVLSFAEAKKLGSLPKEREARLEALYARLKKESQEKKAPLFVDGKWRPRKEVEEVLSEKMLPSLPKTDSSIPLEQRRLWLWTKSLREKFALGETLEGGSEDPVRNMFALQKTEKTIARKGKEQEMIEEGFSMLPETWSSPRATPEGKISFFFLKERGIPEEPILAPLRIARERLAVDLQRSLAKEFIMTMKTSGSIVIPEEPKPL